jgi:Na+-transporting NADH:ubiquinone oxidoreductase subunit NqrB
MNIFFYLAIFLAALVGSGCVFAIIASWDKMLVFLIGMALGASLYRLFIRIGAIKPKSMLEMRKELKTKQGPKE